MAAKDGRSVEEMGGSGAGAATDRVLGSWRLLEPLAVGRTGVVFDGLSASAAGDEAPVAIHLPFARHQERVDLQRAHLTTTRLAMAVRHPRLTAVLDGGMDRVVWRVLERADGWTVDDALRRGRTRSEGLPDGVAVHLLLQAAEGLAALHAAGRVHGRLTPARVLVGTEGGVKVCGWMSPDRALRPSQALLIPGAIPELAPEQLDGQAPTTATDVYQLAVLGVCLYGGGRPFARLTPEQAQKALLTESMPVPPGTPSLLGELLSLALRRAPEERPDLEDVREVLNGLRSDGAAAGASWLGRLFEAGPRSSSARRQALGVADVESVLAQCADRTALPDRPLVYTLRTPPAPVFVAVHEPVVPVVPARDFGVGALSPSPGVRGGGSSSSAERLAPAPAPAPASAPPLVLPPPQPPAVTHPTEPRADAVVVAPLPEAERRPLRVGVALAALLALGMLAWWATRDRGEVAVTSASESPALAGAPAERSSGDAAPAAPMPLPADPSPATDAPRSAETPLVTSAVAPPAVKAAPPSRAANPPVAAPARSTSVASPPPPAPPVGPPAPATPAAAAPPPSSPASPPASPASDLKNPFGGGRP